MKRKNVVLVVIDTLRRDHLGCYGTAEASSMLSSTLATPQLDRLAARGTVMEQAHLGSFPCLPARRDLWTGRYEFPWRGWGPLEDDDLDLFQLLRSHGWKTAMISDHYHMLEAAAGNYHYGFDGWEMIRGQEHDPYVTDPLQTPVAIDDATSPVWRTHLQNLRGAVRSEEELYAPLVFGKAAAWLDANAAPHVRKESPFCLLVECFDPHEPWDPPEELIERFDPGYAGKRPHSPAYGSAGRFSGEQLRQLRALYAAELTLVDRSLGKLLDAFDRHGLWEDTFVAIVTDHGFFLGEHGWVGKPNKVPLYREMSHIPMLLYDPDAVPGTRCSDLVQLVDLFPTVLDALGIELPAGEQIQADEGIVGSAGKKAWEGIAETALLLHGRSLLPLLRGEPAAPFREAVFTGKFGDIVRICDGEWSLYAPPLTRENTYWYGLRTPGRLFFGTRGKLDRVKGRYPVDFQPVTRGAELYHLRKDPGETVNVLAAEPEQAKRLLSVFGAWLRDIGAPPEVSARYGADR